MTLDIYTTENDQNLKMNCSRNAYGQLRNENLFTPMTHQFKQYRFTTCKLDDMDSNLLHCTGGTTIQDYLPRHYGFSFDYACRRSLKPSLVGLSYNFTISQQSNETKCSATPSVIFNCRQFYDLMSLPNMIGDPDWSSVKDWVYDLKTIDAIVSTFVFPQCNATMNQVIHTCREMCFEAMDACLPHAEIYLQTIVSLPTKLVNNWIGKSQIDLSDSINRNYLPSVNDSIPCFYKAVICGSPPNITNARLVKGHKANDETYRSKSQVQYECLDETFWMEGNGTVICRDSRNGINYQNV